jgi:hypothetical protein
MERACRGVVSIDRSIKKVLARRFQLVLAAQSIEKSSGGTEIRNC